MEIITILILCFLLAVLAPIISRNTGIWSGWLLALLPAAIVVWLVVIFPDIQMGNDFRAAYSWLPQLNMGFSFRLDGLTWLFAMLIFGIGSLILVYAGYYMKTYGNTKRFFAYLVFFMGAMFGLVAANDLMTLFLFWELTSVTSFLLIGFKHHLKAARDAALQALLITGTGGLALLGAFILLGIEYQSFSIEFILQKPEIFLASKYFIPISILLMIGAFTKSAIFPFHFWLPGAMQAPSPVSAFLHSATMVKAGIFLLARFLPLYQQSDFWIYTLTIFGATTMFAGGWLSMAQNDLKKILAYTTVSALGTLVLLLGTGTAYALTAALVFLLVHAFYKATLFMMAGNLEKKTGTRQMDALGGLQQWMPVAAVISYLALLSMSGVPPMLGFIGKELIYEAKIKAPDAAIFILIAGFLANVFMVFVSARIAFSVFLGTKKTFDRKVVEPDVALLTGPGILVVLSLLLGMFPQIAQSLISPAFGAIAPGESLVKLKLWHGFNNILLLSAITVSAGLVLYAIRNQLIATVGKLNELFFNLHFCERFFAGMNAFLGFASRKTSFLQHGYHRFYLITMILSATALLWYGMFAMNFSWDGPLFEGALPWIVVVAVFVIVSASIATVTTSNRLNALIYIGLVGIGLTIIFIYYGGVDLAITLIVVETLMIVIGAMVVYRLPKYIRYSGVTSRVRDVIVSVIFGATITSIILAISPDYQAKEVAAYFVENSLSKGFGENIVNVILVDFRALDTMGEITVLALAAIGIVSLLKLKLVD